MILYLRWDGSGYDPGDVALSALENLGMAGANGHQFVTGDRDAIARIADDVRLSIRARTYYRRVEQGLTQFGSLIRSSPKLVINGDDEALLPAGGRIPLGVFSDANYCEKSQLLVENLTDFDVLVALARLFVDAKHRGLDVCFRAQHGGGSTTAHVMEHLGEVPCGPVICVVDSDRSYNGGAAGSTAKSAGRSARRARDSWRVRIEVLPQRELENLIPNDLRDLCIDDSDIRDQMRLLERVDYSYSDYCCLKHGDSICRMISSVISKNRVDLITVIGQIDGRGLLVEPPCGTCPVPNGCFRSPGLGAGFLQRVAAELKSGAAKTRVENWRDDLIRLVETIVFWGASLAPQRS